MQFIFNELQKYLTKYLVIFGLISICGMLVGCHPCSVVSCPGDGRLPERPPIDLPEISAVAYKNTKGDIYIDIPNKKNYKSIQLLNLSITSSGNEQKNEIFWELTTPNSINREDAVNINIFPLHYGSNLEKTIMERHSPKMIEPGVYIISGHIIAKSDAGVYSMMRVVGKFGYKNGNITVARKPYGYWLASLSSSQASNDGAYRRVA